MKQKFILLLALCLSLLLLCGCGPVTEAEEAIAALGTITPESMGEIEQVDLLLDELSLRQLNRVENLQDFKDKKAYCQRMLEMIDNTKTAINAIGKVTPDSGNAITAAREAYDELNLNNLTGYVSSEYTALENAEREFREITGLLEKARSSIDAIGTVTINSKEAIEKADEAVTALTARGLQDYFASEIARLDEIRSTFGELEAVHLYNEAIEYFIDGYYYLGQDTVDTLAQTYPSHNKTALIASEVFNILLQKAETALGAKDYLQADDALNFCDDNYKAAAFASTKYSDLRTRLDTELEKLRPKTGKVFHNSTGGGYGRIKLTAGPFTDSLVRVVSVKDSEKYALFYVRANETATVYISDGEYYIKYINGFTWYGEDNKFGDPNAKESQFTDTAEFTTTYSGNYVHYTVITATISF